MAGAGYKLFQTGDVLTATEVNTYLQQQVTMVFANSAARTSALSGVLAEGMMSYLQDTNLVEVYDGSSWVSVGNTGDITAVTAGTGLTGGGTSGAVTLTNDMATTITAKGDLLVGTGNATYDNLAVGTNGYTLVADSSVSPHGLKWAAPGYPTFSGCQLVLTNDYTLATATTYTVAWTTETYDTDNYHDNSTNNTRITIPTTGYYRLTGATVLNATGSQVLVRFTKNGNDFKHNTEEGSVYAYAFGHCFATGYFAANDYLEMSIRHDRGTNATVFSGSYYTWFAIERLG